VSLRFEGVELPLAEFALTLDLRLAARATLIVGASGAGKSSLLELVAGLRRPRRGRIALDGAALDDPARGIHRPPPARGVGWVPQEGALFPHLSVRANLLYGAPRGGGADLATLVDRLELAGLLDRSPATLSGGEQRRVAIGRALLSGARILLVDEPFAGLDRALRERVAEALFRVRDEVGVRVVVVSHDLDGLGAWAEEIVVLERGRVVARGAPQELLEVDTNALRLRALPREGVS
jgi:molybdate transport system ATP-binding protein